MRIKESWKLGLLNRLDDDGATSSQDRADLDKEHGGWVVPKNDGSNHTNWFNQSVGLKSSRHLHHHAVDFIHCSSIVSESVCNLRNVHGLKQKL